MTWPIAVVICVLLLTSAAVSALMLRRAWAREDRVTREEKVDELANKVADLNTRVTAINVGRR